MDSELGFDTIDSGLVLGLGLVLQFDTMNSELGFGFNTIVNCPLSVGLILKSIPSPLSFSHALGSIPWSTFCWPFLSINTMDYSQLSTFHLPYYRVDTMDYYTCYTIRWSYSAVNSMNYIWVQFHGQLLSVANIQLSIQWTIVHVPLFVGQARVSIP